MCTRNCTLTCQKVKYIRMYDNWKKSSTMSEMSIIYPLPNYFMSCKLIHVSKLIIFKPPSFFSPICHPIPHAIDSFTIKSIYKVEKNSNNKKKWYFIFAQNIMKSNLYIFNIKFTNPSRGTWNLQFLWTL